MKQTACLKIVEMLDVFAVALADMQWLLGIALGNVVGEYTVLCEVGVEFVVEVVVLCGVDTDFVGSEADVAVERVVGVEADVELGVEVVEIGIDAVAEGAFDAVG